jgi:thiopurine S-methyltransferase
MNVAHFWEERYTQNNMGWDLGKASPPIMGFMQQWPKPGTKILIPGAGNAYEAQWLHQQGFKNVHVADVASSPLQNLKKRCPDFPAPHLHQQDFFTLNETFDLILEQTFFCALPPSQRTQYVRKMHELLSTNGLLTGVLFQFELTDQGPPYGGSAQEYEELFRPYFKILKLEPCYNSVKPRQGKELFFKLLKIAS